MPEPSPDTFATDNGTGSSDEDEDLEDDLGDALAAAAAAAAAAGGIGEDGFGNIAEFGAKEPDASLRTAQLAGLTEQLSNANRWSNDVEVPTEVGQPRRFSNKAKLLRLLRDSSISRDRPVDRLTKIRRCAERAEAAQAGKASIDGDQLRLHHDYAFAFVENARDQPRLWVGRLVRMVMRKPGLKPQLYARPVDLAGDLTGLQLFCNWYEDKGNGCYSLVNAVEDKNPYTVECLLGVVELDYDDSTRLFSLAADWAAPGRHDNVLRRFLGDVEVERLVLSVAARCGVLPLTSKGVKVQTWSKDLLLLCVANDVLRGDSVRRICIVNNEDCDQHGLHYITVVYSVHRSADSPAARRDAGKLAHLKAALAAARLARRAANRLESRDADNEEV